MLHFNDIVRSFWNGGLICGFMSMKKSVMKLRRLPEGTFVVNFTDMHECLMVSVMTNDGPVVSV